MTVLSLVQESCYLPWASSLTIVVAKALTWDILFFKKLVCKLFILRKLL